MGDDIFAEMCICCKLTIKISSNHHVPYVYRAGHAQDKSVCTKTKKEDLLISSGEKTLQSIIKSFIMIAIAVSIITVIDATTTT